MESIQAQKHSIFNSEYEILEQLGDGTSSRVFLCRHLKDKKRFVALKLIRYDFLRKKNGLRSIEDEIRILRSLDHSKITKMYDYGSDGKILKPSGRELPNQVYILLEYVPGKCFFDLVQEFNGLGEKGGRFFMDQLIEVILHLQEKKIAHRDMKLENILVDNNFNLKVADFGFATSKNILKLDQYCGTKSYMAPEIIEGKIYNGMKADIFSVGVILFITVLGLFPFTEARKGEQFYQLLIDKNYEKYWVKTCRHQQLKISDSFKDLIQKMLSYDPEMRPDIDEIKNHQWIQSKFDSKKYRQLLINSFQPIEENEINKTQTNGEDKIEETQEQDTPINTEQIQKQFSKMSLDRVG